MSLGIAELLDDPGTMSKEESQAVLDVLSTRRSAHYSGWTADQVAEAVQKLGYKAVTVISEALPDFTKPGFSLFAIFLVLLYCPCHLCTSKTLPDFISLAGKQKQRSLLRDLCPGNTHLQLHWHQEHQSESGQRLCDTLGKPGVRLCIFRNPGLVGDRCVNC